MQSGWLSGELRREITVMSSCAYVNLRLKWGNIFIIRALLPSQLWTFFFWINFSG